MKAVIPVAGRGTRFLPATKQIPKELIPILGVPMLHHVVMEAVASGLEEIIMVTSVEKQLIEDFYRKNTVLEKFLDSRGKTKELNLIKNIHTLAEIRYVRQNDPLGLGHAIFCAKNSLKGEDRFAVLLGDDITLGHPRPVTEQLLNVSEKHQNAPVIGVMEVSPSETNQYGIIEGTPLDGRTYKMTGMIEKPLPHQAPSRLATPGRYLLPCDIFDLLERAEEGKGGEIQLTDAIHHLCQRKDGLVLAHHFSGERYDTGNIKGLLNTSLEFALKDNSLKEYAIQIMRDKLERYE